MGEKRCEESRFIYSDEDCGRVTGLHAGYDGLPYGVTMGEQSIERIGSCRGVLCLLVAFKVMSYRMR